MKKTKPLNYIVLGISVAAGLLVGILINDVPFFSVDKNIRPFEPLTFFAVTVFGFWFQQHQRKKNSGSGVLLKILEETLKSTSKELDAILDLIDAAPTDQILGDDAKKKIFLKLKSISFDASFIKDRTNGLDVDSAYLQLKDKIISEDFSTANFNASLEYRRSVNSEANQYKTCIKNSICEFLQDF